MAPFCLALERHTVRKTTYVEKPGTFASTPLAKKILALFRKTFTIYRT